MDQSRRDFIKMSATVVGGASLGIQINANAQDGQAGSKVSVKSMKPLAGTVRASVCDMYIRGK